MLRYKILVALTIAVAAPALAGSHPEHGEADGEAFEYTTELDAKGIIRVAGIVDRSREHFRLYVDRYGHVQGHFGNRAVEYDVGRKLRDRVAAQLEQGIGMADATTQR